MSIVRSWTVTESTGNGKYEEQAASALAQMVLKPSNEQSTAWFTQRLSISVSTEEDEESRSQYSEAIANRIRTLLTELEESQDREPLTLRLKRLAVVLASLDRGESTDLVLRVIGIQGDWDAWYTVDALEHLIRRGVRPPAEATLAVVDATIGQLTDDRQYGDQTQSLRERILCILPFLYDPEAGINRVRDLLAELPRPNSGRATLFGALATGGSDNALELLVELYEESDPPEPRLAMEWTLAIASIDHPRARSLLIGFLDPDIEGVATGLPHEAIDTLAGEIAKIAGSQPETMRRVIELCSVEVSQIQRELLGQVIGELGSPEMVLAGLDLIADDKNPPVPSGVRRAMERTLVEHRPQGGRNGFYTPVPRNGAAVRSKLFGYVVSDDGRRRSAEQLLGEVDEWRLDSGKPTSEPRHPAIESGSPWPPVMADD